MPRILGVDVPSDKRVEIALTYIYGIGRYRARRILEAVGIEAGLRAKNLTEDELSRIATHIDNTYIVGGPLKRQVAQNVARLREINCYRGLRHRKNLPVRGQRTRTNARTRKGPRRTVATKKSVKTLK